MTNPVTGDQNSPSSWFRAWGKLESDATAGHVTGWHSLPGHSIDVAAVFYALIETATMRHRLETLAQRLLTKRDVERLAAIAFLHDLGKANAGFWSRAFNDDGRRKFGLYGVNFGHLFEVGGLFAQDMMTKAATVLPLTDLVEWCGGEACANEYLTAMLAHHGRPIDPDKFSRKSRDTRWLWQLRGGYDPFAALVEFNTALRSALPAAFEAGGHPLPDQTAFIHAFCGLLQLSDWIGSDQNRFRFDQGDWRNRWSSSLDKARSTLEALGFDGSRLRASVPAGSNTFASLFIGREGRPLSNPTRLQTEGGVLDRGRIALFESETGSGKTEAALWRFAMLFAAGDVDSLYFALPTRVSASMMYERVRNFAQRLFGTDRPGVILAVPGQVKLDGEDLLPLPDEPRQWTENKADAVSSFRWAAERPKRFLAARIAVGTIDQALLSALQTKHVHLRHVCLMRSLLVVDEVHASDTYMTRILEQLLDNHTRAGGHALLMSATLGASARARLLTPKKGIEPKNLETAIGTPYPAVSWAGGQIDVRTTRQSETEDKTVNKAVELSVEPWIDAPERVAALAVEAAVAGAKVLVIRNTVKAAQATQAEIEARLGLAHTALFRCKDAVSLHHGRFARQDRALLDRAVENTLGKDRPEGPVIVVGTQTLEQSLDIDADLLITDLCPVDVLLQRIGRLFRHERKRSVNFQQARVHVLVPTERDLLQARGNHGLGLSRGPNAVGVYENLLAIEATWQLVIQHPRWNIPAMNRELVERATHPEAIASILDALQAVDRVWGEVYGQIQGRRSAHVGEARNVVLRTDLMLSDPANIFPDTDEKILTRLGAADRRLLLPQPTMGPFGQQIGELTIPGHWAIARAIREDGYAEEVKTFEGAFMMRIGTKWLRYDRCGLSIATKIEACQRIPSA